MIPLELHTRALAVAGDAVAAVRPGRLDLPTPCAGWTLGRLLEHVVGQHRGFAAAAWGAGPDLATWQDAPLTGGPLTAFRTSADQLTAAFGAAATAAGSVELWLPEISTERTVPLRRAVGFHLLDTLVHGWDVAAALGVPERVTDVVDGDPELAGALLAVAREVPAGPADRAPGRAFRERGPDDPAVGPFDRALALLGRDPAWRPPGA
ncbi:TIGR03086 family metal-binding protein [Kitasatospora sp. NPDC004240]